MLFLESTNLVSLNVDWRKADHLWKAYISAIAFVPTGHMKTPRLRC